MRLTPTSYSDRSLTAARLTTGCVRRLNAPPARWCTEEDGSGKTVDDPYYDLDGNMLADFPVDALSNAQRRIGSDDLPGDVRVSTVHLVINHQWDSRFAPLIFETMIFGSEDDEWQCRWATKRNAEAGHKATVGWVLREGPEPMGDYAMTRVEWEASRVVTT